LGKNGRRVKRNKKYIVVDAKSLDIKIATMIPKSGFVVPSVLGQRRFLSPIEKTIYFEILYKAVYEEDRRKGIRNRAYKLAYPDAWLVAISYIIWQGIIQGFAWDSLKFIVRKALEKLRKESLAPKNQPHFEKVKSRSETRAVIEIGYTYSEYGIDGRKIYSIFRGLKRIYCKTTEEEREKISNSKVEDENKHR